MVQIVDSTALPLGGGLYSAGAQAGPEATGVLYRRARLSDVPELMELLNGYVERGILLPRSPAQVYRTLREYVVAVDAEGIVGCSALRIYTETLGEVCAVAVAERAHGLGIGSRLVEMVVEEAYGLGLRRLFAMTLQEIFFRRLGFRPVPLEEIPEKIAADRADGIDRALCPKLSVVRDL